MYILSIRKNILIDKCQKKLPDTTVLFFDLNQTGKLFIDCQFQYQSALFLFTLFAYESFNDSLRDNSNTVTSLV